MDPLGYTGWLIAVDGKNPAKPVDMVVHHIIYMVSKTSQVVVWDFWTIKRIIGKSTGPCLFWLPSSTVSFWRI